MENLYSLEQLALNRQVEMTRQSDRHFLVQQAESARDALPGKPVGGSSVRSSIGRLLGDIGLRLSNIVLSKRRAGAAQCVCVPTNN